MALIVQKFGGTSVATVPKIKKVAEIIAGYVKDGNRVVAVVSAMSGETDRLIGVFNEACGLEAGAPPPSSGVPLDEYDTIVATGEQVTSAVLSTALQSMGLKAASVLGWQVPIITSNAHSKAKISEISNQKLLSLIEDGVIPVVSGFQGVTEGGKQTTLGRGGSDTTAIALAAAISADRCDIFTDVSGVFTADPRIVPRARALAMASYDEVLEMSSSGAKVLETRSVVIAMKYQVRTRVLSTFQSDHPGTLLTNQENMMEERLVTGIASHSKIAQVFVIGLPNTPGSASKLFCLLSENNISVDVIAQSPAYESTRNKNDIVFTIHNKDVRAVHDLLASNKGVIKYESFEIDTNIAEISVVGMGMKRHAGVAYIIFKILSEKGINILTITTSEIRVSVVINRDYTELAIRSLHDAFGLDGTEELGDLKDLQPEAEK